MELLIRLVIFAAVATTLHADPTSIGRFQIVSLTNRTTIVRADGSLTWENRPVIFKIDTQSGTTWTYVEHVSAGQTTRGWALVPFIDPKATDPQLPLEKTLPTSNPPRPQQPK